MTSDKASDIRKNRDSYLKELTNDQLASYRDKYKELEKEYNKAKNMYIRYRYWSRWLNRRKIMSKHNIDHTYKSSRYLASRKRNIEQPIYDLYEYKGDLYCELESKKEYGMTVMFKVKGIDYDKKLLIL